MMRKIVQACREKEKHGQNAHQESKNYLESPLEEVVDRVKQWGVSIYPYHLNYTNTLQHHFTQYPVLSRIARDYLAIQGSSTASEHAFSQGGLTVTLLCNSLNPDAVEALQILKDSYRSGDLAAGIEALQWEVKSWVAETDQM